MAEMAVRVEGLAPVAAPGGRTGNVLPTQQSAIPALPASTAVLAGTAVTTGTIITIPAGRTWWGYVTCSASFHSATQAQAVVGVATTGTNVVPAPAGKIFEIRLSVDGPAAGETAAHETVVTPFFAVYAPAGNAGTIALNTGAAQDVTATAYGWLV
ncbi:hypothetical protein SEA_OLICIOUS_43 [Streptomyces phage Olicious]|uniref:Uncharacterized protein n=7 Tax=Immanueltrevirus immanuel3 TaxID=2846399 RepID=A0A2H5BLZ3_9CAUD|nr:hypothetical protein HWB41_gp55 [Streptomyces phage Immanuel3]AUG87348.1 hypothetical protein SEA_HAUGEANATOR_43 [Streptomyces phage HaugeAnator]AUG87412.1 hypothetical protein SEA_PERCASTROPHE_43 [Streptomyces phage Percastrophe]AUG87476.1 hypothetical protein SEA_ROMERO_43 [Streptomyces phage Romero]AUG87540.1 hypothetical protein SEA_TORITOKI_43 [Streptomyces phage ToriToki]AUG87604.1 hypothetical protein SEA_ZOOBEAR_43 [Streptomyces phage ZooBear]AZF95831.1 hypothetical protein SEA_OLI